MTQATEPVLNKEEWDDLINGVQEVFETRTMTPQRYMTLYTYVFNYCTKKESPMQQVTGAINTGGNRRGGGRTRAQKRTQSVIAQDELYKTLHTYLRRYVNGLAENILADGGGPEKLSKYARLWRDYDFSSTVVTGVFAYFNMHKAREETQMPGGDERICDVRQLTMRVWRETIFDLVHKELTEAVLQLIKANRDGEPLSRDLLKEALDSYIQLGSKATAAEGELDDEDGPAQSLAIYREHFEVPFLKATRTYYTAEADVFLSQHPMIDYIKRVETRLAEERNRCELYFHYSTLGPLNEVLNEVMIIEKLQSFEAEFQALFKEDVDVELARVYAILSRVERALSGVLAFTEDYIKDRGAKAIEEVAQSAVNDPEQYVQTILKVHAHYDELLQKAFNRDTRFVRAMDLAHSVFINQNAVTDAVKSSNKSSELLVRYIDTLLRKGGKVAGEQQDLDKLIDQAITVFKYINDKDVFEKYYLKRLAMRIVNNLSTSDEAEMAMMTKLQQICGLDYTSKMQKLFTDKNLSADLSERYKSQAKGGAPLDFAITALSKNMWPFDKDPEAFPLPAQLDGSLQQFTIFYNTQFNGRKLELLLSRSKGEVVCNNLPRKHIFVVTTAQIAILLQFNTTAEMQLGALVEVTGIDKATVVKNLQPMLKEKLLIVVGSGEGKELDASAADSTQLKFNETFTHKKMKVELTRLARGKDSEGKKEDEGMAKELDVDRRNVIQAAIVRIMKARKRYKHTQLISEVIRQTTRFEPTVPMIKKCVEELIEKEYIKRAMDDVDSYDYIA